MKNDMVTSWTGSLLSGIGAVLSALSTEDILRLVSLAVSIAAGIITIAYTLVCLHKAHKQDGKVTADEVKESIDVILKGSKDAADKVKEIADIVENGKKKEAIEDGDND